MSELGFLLAHMDADLGSRLLTVAAARTPADGARALTLCCAAPFCDAWAAGGWYHPVHLHLVDLYVIHRKENNTSAKLQYYEALVPKDVIYLPPSGEVWILVK